jgi:hypothetical protein
MAINVTVSARNRARGARIARGAGLRARARLPPELRGSRWMATVTALRCLMRLGVGWRPERSLTNCWSFLERSSQYFWQ